MVSILVLMEVILQGDKQLWDEKYINYVSILVLMEVILQADTPDRRKAGLIKFQSLF